MSYAPIFGKIKGVIEIHSHHKFHQYSICGCEVMCFQMFSKEQKVQFLTASGWYFKHYSSNDVVFVQKFPQGCSAR